MTRLLAAAILASAASSAGAQGQARSQAPAAPIVFPAGSAAAAPPATFLGSSISLPPTGSLLPMPAAPGALPDAPLGTSSPDLLPLPAAQAESEGPAPVEQRPALSALQDAAALPASEAASEMAERPEARFKRVFDAGALGEGSPDILLLSDSAGTELKTYLEGPVENDLRRAVELGQAASGGLLNKLALDIMIREDGSRPDHARTIHNLAAPPPGHWGVIAAVSPGPEAPRRAARLALGRLGGVVYRVVDHFASRRPHSIAEWKRRRNVEKPYQNLFGDMFAAMALKGEPGAPEEDVLAPAREHVWQYYLAGRADDDRVAGSLLAPLGYVSTAIVEERASKPGLREDPASLNRDLIARFGAAAKSAPYDLRARAEGLAMAGLLEARGAAFKRRQGHTFRGFILMILAYMSMAKPLVAFLVFLPAGLFLILAIAATASAARAEAGLLKAMGERNIFNWGTQPKSLDEIKKPLAQLSLAARLLPGLSGIFKLLRAYDAADASLAADVRAKREESMRYVETFLRDVLAGEKERWTPPSFAYHVRSISKEPLEAYRVRLWEDASLSAKALGSGENGAAGVRRILRDAFPGSSSVSEPEFLKERALALFQDMEPVFRLGRIEALQARVAVLYSDLPRTRDHQLAMKLSLLEEMLEQLGEMAASGAPLGEAYLGLSLTFDALIRLWTAAEEAADKPVSLSDLTGDE